MAIRYINFDKDDSHASDYLYTAQDFRDVYSAIVSNGIVLPLNADLTTDTSLKVTAITGGVNIGDGKLSANGAFGLVKNSVSAENVLISTDGTYKIVLEMNKVLNMIYSKAITGDLTRTDNVYQIQIATVVKSGSTYTITDTRTDTSLCGYANRLPESQAVVLQNQLNSGWIPSTATLTLSSADSPVFVVGTSVNLSSIIGIKDRIKFTQNNATIYAIVVAITSTTMTLLIESGKVIANTTTYPISNVYFSHQSNPLGFPTNPDVWSVVLTNSVAQNQANPVKDTVYNLGGLYIDEPIGMWHFCSNFTVYSYRGTAGTCSMFAGLSTTNNSFSNAELKKYSVSGAFSSTGEFAMDMGINCLAHIATVKTRWYVVASTFHTGITNLTLQNGVVSLNIKLTCAYL